MQRLSAATTMEYAEQAVRVGPSLYGLGVFATRSFAVHELIGPIRGTVIDDPEYESDYCMTLGEHSSLEPDWPFRLVNHSCQPNCQLLEFEPDSAGVAADELWLEVLCDIAPDEQITIDYAWPAAEGATACRCGSPRCRGWIVAGTPPPDVAPGGEAD
jgi:uncharacterized protein